MRYVPRILRIDLDWLFGILRDDPGVYIKHINTKEQCADIFTKGMFTEAQFKLLMFLCNLGTSYISDGETHLKRKPKKLNVFPHAPAFCLCAVGVRPIRARTTTMARFIPHAKAPPEPPFRIPPGEPNPYDVLGIPTNASLNLCKEAYQAHILYWHPDKFEL